MDLIKILKLLKHKKKEIILISIAGGFLGFAATLLPTKYFVEQSYFVGRKVYSGSDFFTYEGYYAQQTANSYANTALAIFDDVTIKKLTLQSLGVEINDRNLKKLMRSYDISKKSPQIVSLKVSNYNYQNALNIYKGLSDNALKINATLIKSSDDSIVIMPLDGSPTIHKAQPSIIIYTITGLVIGLLFSISKISFKEYAK